MPSSNVYHGACHCGHVKYQIRLTLPPIHDVNAESVRIYKCNCSTCQKMGYFHCRPISAADDFILTSPATIDELGDYRAFTKKIGWYFCTKCGVRVFGLGGAWKQDEIDVDKWAGREGGHGHVQKVWKTTPDDFLIEVDGKQQTKTYHYLSVNAVTLEPGEGGVDLIEWHNKGWVFYVENRDRSGGQKMRFGEPHPGGMV